ncbi:MAG: UDP-N-acetylglucosamine 2-epimerase (hydrolyzing), partial [Candidatus Marinimicrobia bacterium]|nr:UDP-N-acetylglucosamine 2-epimerase (hydrolyzing) [Candidatus Neomarinimicrobiota bacterium]
VIGNSSSGITEAPAFNIGTVNIGDRQSGRIKGSSIIDCNADYDSIDSAIDKLYSKNFQNKLPLVKNPYGEGDAIEKIMNILLNQVLPEDTKKVFYDL